MGTFTKSFGENPRDVSLHIHDCTSNRDNDTDFNNKSSDFLFKFGKMCLKYKKECKSIICCRFFKREILKTK